MNKNAIKKFATEARRELISRVSQRALKYGISDKEVGNPNDDSVGGHLLSSTEKKQRAALIAQIKEKGYEQVMEEVAYTWFNRFSALRFMEVNGYLPSHVRVFTDEENNFKPQIISEAIHLELDGLDMEKVYAYKEANDNDELYKYLLITQCNALNNVLPGMFQKIADYTELLFPDNLLREGSVIQQMIELIPEDDWKDAVQIIGWLYQYYNSEKKDDVFAALKKNVKITKENIPAATQLFTPDWIVRYMVENSLGRLWLEGHPDVKEQLLPTKEEQSAYAAGNRDLEDTKWHYYLEEAEQEPEVQAQLAEIRKEYAALTPDQLKVIDPCSGSGHILAYMFDVLMKIYESYGYTTREAVASIVENNLYGLDIDDRAAQLAYFAVMMKARQYDRRIFSRGIQPHVYAIVESNGLDSSSVEYFTNNDPQLKKDFGTLMNELRDAKEYGSILNISQVDFSALYARVEEVRADISMFREIVLNSILPLIQVAEVMAQKYDAVVTNPPYMGAGGMSGKLSEFVKKEYPETKSDLSTVFMEKTLQISRLHGYVAMINIPVWMFLSTYEKMRNTIIANNTITTMLHFGRGIFGSDFGTTAFSIQKGRIEQYQGSYRRLFEKQGAVDTVETKERWFLEGKGSYISTQNRFSNIPGNPVAYWMSSSVENDFVTGQALSSVAEIKQGLKTGDNEKFLRLWFEVSSTKFSPFSGTKWFPCNKGGDYRRWYGNNDYVINWENDGFELKNFRHPDGRQKSRPQNLQYLFREGLTYTNISSSKFGIRYCPKGFAFDAAGSMIFTSSERLYYLLGLLSSNTVLSFTSILSPTMSFEVGQIANIPFLSKPSEKIDNLVKNCITVAKDDWDSFETSWDFQQHPLVAFRHSVSKVQNNPYHEQSWFLKDAYQAWEYQCDLRFEMLKKNEEELNRRFIDIYSLQGELTPEVEDTDITVRRADLGRDIRSLISYAVGCMFGRYSLDKPGLVFAGYSKIEQTTRTLDGDDPELEKFAKQNADGSVSYGSYYHEVSQNNYKSFPIDTDNIIPICDDDYFDDDITGRFVKWVETVYGKETLEENLKFIADALGGKGTPREVIRSYFLNDFYADHCSTYSVTGSGKRPIYWLFDSGKKNGFKALIYMHRYQSDLLARMRTDYVHEQQERYRTQLTHLTDAIEHAGAAERVKLTKQQKKLQEQALEIQKYEEKIHHLADQNIQIDLDDGVKHNYELFADVLAKIK